MTEFAAASFTATATLAATAPVAAVTASVHFTGEATIDVYAAPLGERRRLIVTDIHGVAFGELENATFGAINYRLGEPEDWTFTLPIGDPKAGLVLDEPFRECQVWRGDQLLAWGPMVRPSADKLNLAVSCKSALWYLTRRFVGKARRTNYVVNGDFEIDGTTHWRIGALSPFEPLANRNPAYWTASAPTERSLTGTHSLRMEQLATGLPKYGVSASQFFVWTVDPGAREGDLWSMTARCWIPSTNWRGPSPDNAMGIMIARYSTTQVIATQPEGGGPVEYLPKPIEAVKIDITEDTPRDVWWPLEATLLAPYTGQPEFVQVTLGCPDGAIYWDRATLTLDEALRFYGVDQAVIARSLLEHLQDPAYGKSDLNLAADMPATGVLRDRVYLHHEHLNGWDAINELTTLDDGFDLSINYTATTRVVRTNHPRKGTLRPPHALELGKNVADFAWTFDGENAASSVIVLGTGNRSDREEASASDEPAYADGLTLEIVFSAPPDTLIESLDDLAIEQLNLARGPDMLSVTTTPVMPGQPDPIGSIWPGDYLPVTLRAGALEIRATYRIVELTITPEDTLDLTLNRRDP